MASIDPRQRQNVKERRKLINGEVGTKLLAYVSEHAPHDVNTLALATYVKVFIFIFLHPFLRGGAILTTSHGQVYRLSDLAIIRLWVISAMASSLQMSLLKTVLWQ